MAKFDPKKHLMQMKGKDYLEVKWRIVWFREDHPNGNITTELASTDPPLMKATVGTQDFVLGTGFGSPKTQGVAATRPFEGAETAAIGRALAVAGYGTQFTGEEEGEHLADAPVDKGNPDQTKNVNALDGDTVKEVVRLNIFENEHSAAQVLARFIPKKAPLGSIIKKASLYRGHKDTGKTTEEAIQSANAGETV